MNTAAIIGVLAVITVAGAGGAYMLDSGSDIVREELRVGDFIEIQTIHESSNGSWTEVERYEIVDNGVNGIYKVKEIEGNVISYENMSKNEFLEELYGDGPQDYIDDGFTRVGTESIPTGFGNRSCEVYTETDDGGNDYAYFGSNGILYKEIDNDDDGSTTRILVDTSLFG